MNKSSWLMLLLFLLLGTKGANAQYWEIRPNHEIVWKVTSKGHHDHIEMSGKRISTVLRYGINANGGFDLSRSFVWPMLRTIPNNTHASLMRHIDWSPLEGVAVNNRPLNKNNEKVDSIRLNGTMVVESRFPNHSLKMKRTLLPATEAPSWVECYEFTNIGKRKLTVDIPVSSTVMQTASEKGVDGSYRIEYGLQNSGLYELEPGASVSFSATFSAYKKQETSLTLNAKEECAKRIALVGNWQDNLLLETPDEVINTMFAFAKIRALESIYETKGGPMHGPGGESYYAAIWANDQAEYINPFFPYAGYAYGNASAVNSFKHFARYMNDEWKPIPSSIIAEGDSYWNGAGDRGDGAMIAYGAARYALACGSKEEARELWPLIEWCLEYCNRKLNDEGVVASNSDELEGRFPAGKANLCTSSLYYDALLSAAYLAGDLGMKPKTKIYRERAAALEKAIEAYFPANVEGFETYAYYKGNDILRSWICVPLTVGIYNHAKGTADALFSPRLWTDNGLLTQAGSKTFWDRSTLYALRGVYMAGEKERATKFMKHYSNTRLLGEHVPYAIEAWPEGSQRHLSAESALYARIVTEGIFGIRPTGLRSFAFTPQLPDEWNEMALRRVRAFDTSFDIEVKRIKAGQLQVTVTQEGKILLNKKVKENTPISCKLK